MHKKFSVYIISCLILCGFGGVSFAMEEDPRKSSVLAQASASAAMTRVVETIDTLGKCTWGPYGQYANNLCNGRRLPSGKEQRITYLRDEMNANPGYPSGYCPFCSQRVHSIRLELQTFDKAKATMLADPKFTERSELFKREAMYDILNPKVPIKKPDGCCD